jgi:TolB-like protein
MGGDQRSFGRYRLDLGQRRLLRDEKPVKLGSRAMDILCVLASAEGRDVSKDELMARVWPGTVVEENNLHVHVSALRKALDEESNGQSCLVMVPGRGYRLIGLGHARQPGPNSLVDGPGLPRPDKPSIAVLPFQNLSGDPEQDYFADGMVEEITGALSRLRDFFVIARNSAFSYKGRSLPVQQISRELGVRYLIEGSVRKAGTRVRITAQLIDGPSGNHLGRTDTKPP